MQLPQCDVCGKQVQLKDGILSISFREVREVQEAHERFKRDHTNPVFHVSDLLTLPERVHWKWHHSKCNGQSSYWIDACRFDTVEKVLQWTIHLMDKTWFQLTDWREVIHRFYPECD